MSGRTSGWKRWTLRIVMALIVLAGAATYWLFYDNRMPSSGSFPIDIAAIRAEANRLKGDKATAIEVETLSHTMTPKIAMAAGTDWGKVDLVRNSYRVVFPKGAIIVDTGYDEPTARKTKADSFDAKAWQRMLGALDDASRIVVTHEHGDHLGGLFTAPHFTALLPKVLLNPEQASGAETRGGLAWPKGGREGFEPFVYDRIAAIAPGVVLIKAPGHTPGSQMVYVQTVAGREYLFMGDIASLADNVALLRIRSRLVTDFITHEDRQSVMLQTQALHALAAAQPGIALVPGHDGTAVTALEKNGLLARGFTPRTP